MSAEYEQALLQRERYGSKGPTWHTFVIIGLLVIIASVVASYFVGNPVIKKPVNIEFQKTVLEQNNGLSDIDYFLLTSQQKDTRYFKKLNNYVNQIQHRFDIISDYLKTNNVELDQKRFDKNVARYRKKIDLILNSRKPLIRYNLSLLNLNRILPKLLSLNADINTLLFNSNASNSHIYFVTRQLFLLERITSNVTILQSNVSDSAVIVSASVGIGRDMALLLRVYSGLLKGDYQMNVTKITNLKVRNEINKITKLANSLAKDISLVLKHGPDAFQFIDLRTGLQKTSLKLQNSYKSLFFQKINIPK